MNSKKALLLFICLSLAGLALRAQHTITGAVIDSTSSEAMPYVNVKLLHSTRGTTTDETGNFSIQATLFDTLQFSFIGYRTLRIPITAADQKLVISMPVIAIILKPVTAYGNIKIAGINANKPDQQSRFTSPLLNTPQYGIMQTVGPSYVLKGAMSHFSKSEKEKEKLKDVKAENSKASIYLETVNSPEVKDALMKKYTLNEQGFYDILAKYNQQYYKSMYTLDRKTLISSIAYFFNSSLTRK